jgi:hypothetical protein
VPVGILGSSYPGQLMAIDTSGMVYRLSPGRAPLPVWQTMHDPDDLGVNGLPGGWLLASSVDACRTELIEEATGRIVWRSPVLLSPVMPVGEQLIGGESGESASREGLVSLDVRTGQERWRRPLTMGVEIVAAVGGVLWGTDWVENQLLAFDVDSGRPVATVGLPRKSRLTGLLDQAGILHIVDECGWLVVDLRQGRIAADVRFEASGMGDVFRSRAVRSTDGRMILADNRGQIFVVDPAQAHRPELVATCPQIKGIGILAGRLIVLSFDGTLTALGVPS